MRVATRRLRSAFKTYRKVLDRAVTDPIGEELKWLAGELGVDRDQEVLTERLQSRIDACPGPCCSAPSAGGCASGPSPRLRRPPPAVAVLDSKRYLALLDSLDALLADPPLLKAAGGAADRVIPKAVLKDYDRLAARVDHALELPPGEERTWPCTTPARPPSAPGTRARRPRPRSASRPRSSPSR